MFFDSWNDTEPGCFACKLDKKCKSPRLKPVGQGKRKILIIGGSPTKGDDEKGEPFSGESGILLRKALAKSDIDLNKDCIRMYSVCCRLPSEREPLLKEIELCRESVYKVIREHKPDIVCLLGMTAVRSIIGSKWKQNLDDINKWRGIVIPFHNDFNVMATYDPIDIIKRENDKGLLLTWERDLSLLKDRMLIKTIRPCKYPVVEILRDRQRHKFLDNMRKNAPDAIAFDYETNCLRPNIKGAKIYSFALSMDGNVAYAMLYDNTITKHIKRILADRSTRKIAANMKFEDAWTRWHIKCKVDPWHWDTMLASHIEDNRPYYNSLKFQVFINFGVPDYAAKAKPYIEAKEGPFNRIHLMSEQELLEYNGLDAAFEFKLAELQKANLYEPHKQKSL